MEISSSSSTQKAQQTQLWAYHLVILLEYLDKILKKIIAKRLSYIVGHYELIPGTQFGERSNSSTIDAAIMFIHNVYSAWNQNKVISALTFNIKDFFDFVNHQRLLTEMQSR